MALCRVWCRLEQQTVDCEVVWLDWQLCFADCGLASLHPLQLLLTLRYETRDVFESFVSWIETPTEDLAFFAGLVALRYKVSNLFHTGKFY